MSGKFCTNCGATRIDEAKFCASCGTRFEAETADHPSATAMTAPHVVAAARGRCDNCGRPAVMGTSRCADCGPAPVLAPVLPPYVGPGHPPTPPVPYGAVVGMPPTPSPQPALPGGYPPAVAASPAPPQGPKSRRWLVGGLVGGVVGLVLLIALATGGSKHTITGSITVYDDYSMGCDLSWGYDDVHEGALVTVTDSDDTVIAKSSLESGYGSYTCEFPFTIQDVPNRDQYWVEVSDRGQVAFSRQEMESNNWNVSLTLGD